MPDTVTQHCLTLSGARKAVDNAIRHAEAIGLPCCIAVTDPAGDAIATVRMDGAPRGSLNIALNKAYTVSQFDGYATSDWWPDIEGNPALVHGITHTPRLIVFGGGVGIFKDNAFVAAIGVSGGTPEQDAEIAEHGAASIV